MSVFSAMMDRVTLYKRKPRQEGNEQMSKPTKIRLRGTHQKRRTRKLTKNRLVKHLSEKDHYALHKFGSKFQVPRPQLIVLSSQFSSSLVSVLSSQFSELSSQFVIPISQVAVPSSQFSVPSFQFPLP